MRLHKHAGPSYPIQPPSGHTRCIRDLLHAAAHELYALRNKTMDMRRGDWRESKTVGRMRAHTLLQKLVICEIKVIQHEKQEFRGIGRTTEGLSKVIFCPINNL